MQAIKLLWLYRGPQFEGASIRRNRQNHQPVARVAAVRGAKRRQRPFCYGRIYTGVAAVLHKPRQFRGFNGQ
jgi:hypothetical protein